MIVRLGHDRGNLTGPIVDGSCVRQSFQAEGDHLALVGVCFATYKRSSNYGLMTLEVLDSKGERLAASTADVSTFRDNSYHEFRVDKPVEAGKPYEIRLRTENCRSGTSVTAKWGRRLKDGHFFIGSKLVQGELAASFLYADKEPDGSMAEVRKPPPLVGPPEGYLPGLVTVVIPHYNCAQLLGEALKSLVGQTYKGFEAIVVDDGSVEGERNAAESMTSIFEVLVPGVRFMALPENRGAPAARNAGAAEGSGEYIFFLDSDCSLYPQALEWLVAALVDDREAAYSYGGFRWGDDEIAPRPFDPEMLRARNYVSTMSLVRRSDFPGFDESLRRHQDWDLWLTLLGAGRRGVCCGKMLFETPKREGGISDDANIPMVESRDIVRRKHGLGTGRGRP